VKPTSVHLILSDHPRLACALGSGRAHLCREVEFPRARLRPLLEEARALGGVHRVVFAGAEPFLRRDLLEVGVQAAYALGFMVEIVTGALWAATPATARERLTPFAGLVSRLAVRRRGPGAPLADPRADLAIGAAREMEIPVEEIVSDAADAGRGPPGAGEGWERFDRCPSDELHRPSRLQVDPTGQVRACRGIVIGDAFGDGLLRVCRSYDPHVHPLAAPLVLGGPAELARRFGLRPDGPFSDACHLCHMLRDKLLELDPEGVAAGISH
jgi:hypothetical protein